MENKSRAESARDQLQKLLKKTSNPSEEISAGVRAVAHLSAKSLRENFAAIHDQVSRLSMLPMIKANAYGHGAVWAARELMDLPGLYGLGVATLVEGEEIRKAIGAGKKIIAFSGALPWTEEKGRFCEKFGITPVIGSDSDWEVFVRQGWAERIPYHLEFNTGMNRIGISISQARAIAKKIGALPPTAYPEGIMSHLAMAEMPESRLSLAQLENFLNLRKELGSVFPGAMFHLANSSAIWNQKYFQIAQSTDIVRPGISLYGVPPWKGAPARGISSVLTLQAQVIDVRKLKAGDQIGYGGTLTVKASDEPFYAAILAMGYADGLSRRLSNSGFAFVGGKTSRFLGVVSMDLSAVSCTAQTKIGDFAEILGPDVDIWAQAQSAETIPYELLTSLSNRVERVYE